MAELTSRQRAVIELLLTGHTISSAATSARVSRKTIQRWSGQPEFVAALRAGSDAALQSAARRLAVMTDYAINAIIGIMQNGGGGRSGPQLRAAEMILSHAVRYSEHADLLERLAVLEQRLEGQ